MSRIGKKIIVIPAKTEVKVEKDTVTVKGPLGELVRTFPVGVKIEVADGKVSFVPTSKKLTVDQNSLWGTIASHVNNMMSFFLNLSMIYSIEIVLMRT